MFPGYDANNPTQAQVDVELAAHGMTIVQIHRAGSGWKYRRASFYNRRVTGFTPIEIMGPLRGHALMQTPDDPTGTEVLGMLNNCGGGKTPWGTVLTCEENFDQYFANYVPGSQGGLSDRIAAPTGASERKWERYHDRFDLSAQPTEYHRFGYIVEIDPYDPSFKPRKHTALGRFKHEGAFPVVTKSGRVAVYSGDDARFEYVYKFVTANKYDPHHRKRNYELLDEGTLYVAKFNADGTGEWMALPSDPESILNTRGTADGLGATKMDRPEDIDVSPTTGKVYLSMTNNTNRKSVAADPGEVAANPRSPADTGNRWGHVIEITEDGNDNGALTFCWEIFLLCGDPSVQGGVLDVDDLVTGKETYFAGFDPSQVSAISAPDNLLFDKFGNLWPMTDGQPSTLGWNDGVFAVPTEGSDRGHLRQFVSAVPGSELASADFASDYRTLFCSIQHPGEGDGIPNSASLWPDGTNPPKPSVIAVWNKRGRTIGER
jgi:secreted PhoX family phosphatase